MAKRARAPRIYTTSSTRSSDRRTAADQARGAPDPGAEASASPLRRPREAPSRDPYGRGPWVPGSLRFAHTQHSENACGRCPRWEAPPTGVTDLDYSESSLRRRARSARSPAPRTRSTPPPISHGVIAPPPVVTRPGVLPGFGGSTGGSTGGTGVAGNSLTTVSCAAAPLRRRSLPDRGVSAVRRDRDSSWRHPRSRFPAAHSQRPTGSSS